MSLLFIKYIPKHVKKRDKNKKNQSNLKREKKPNLEGRFNKEDKKVSQGKPVNTQTLSISKKGRSSKSEADIKVKKNKKTKI